jgi:hypothetical protein
MDELGFITADMRGRLMTVSGSPPEFLKRKEKGAKRPGIEGQMVLQKGQEKR